MSGVKHRVALVTGAGSANGIGYATANLLRAAGASSNNINYGKNISKVRRNGWDS